MTPEQLRASILQQAMEGKLVKQDPNDEPASELLEKIKAEQLVKAKKLRRLKPYLKLRKTRNRLIFLKIGNGLD